MTASKAIAVFSTDPDVRDWITFQVAPILGCRTYFLETNQINSRRDMHLEAGLILDARRMSSRQLLEWVSDWRRVDPDWPVIMVVESGQEELACDLLWRGVMNFIVWPAPEVDAASAWLAIQVKKMLDVHMPPEHFEWNGITLNARNRVLTVEGKTIVLSVGEALILGKLLAAAGGVVHRTEMARSFVIARLSHAGMAAHLYRLRKALRRAGIDCVTIQSSRLGGYWLEIA